jgi:CRISPR-associated protein Csm5
MAVPGTEFTGECSEREFLKQPEVARALHLRSKEPLEDIVAGANRFARHLLDGEEQYAATAKLARVADAVRGLRGEVESLEQRKTACLMNLGWGGGLATKSAVPDRSDEVYRRGLRQLPFYSQAIRTGLPFPKTRRIVFVGNEPATLPGWVRLEIE